MKGDKWTLLDLTYHQTKIKQPENLKGKPLSHFGPWETENIVGDGNCLFQCLSKIITGNQESHAKVRAIIARFIASEGTTQLQWYFLQKNMPPCAYFLDENRYLGRRRGDNGCCLRSYSKHIYSLRPTIIEQEVH